MFPTDSSIVSHGQILHKRTTMAVLIKVREGGRGGKGGEREGRGEEGKRREKGERMVEVRFILFFPPRASLLWS